MPIITIAHDSNGLGISIEPGKEGELPSVLKNSPRARATRRRNDFRDFWNTTIAGPRIPAAQLALHRTLSFISTGEIVYPVTI